MPRVDWDEWRHALDVFMWQAISLTMRLPQQDYEKWNVLEWPPVHSSFAWIGKLHDPYVERLRKATYGFRGATQVSLVSPKPGDPSWRVVSMPEFGAWVAALGWSVPDEFPWVAPPAAPADVASRSANGKRWTPEELDTLREYRAAHGTKGAAAKYGISKQRIRKLLPGEKPAPRGYSAFNSDQK